MVLRVTCNSDENPPPQDLFLSPKHNLGITSVSQKRFLQTGHGQARSMKPNHRNKNLKLKLQSSIYFQG